MHVKIFKREILEQPNVLFCSTFPAPLQQDFLVWCIDSAQLQMGTFKTDTSTSYLAKSEYLIYPYRKSGYQDLSDN